MKYLIFSILILVIPLISIASEETPLKLTTDGKLEGLPSIYSNAYFDPVTFTLTINEHKIKTPKCVTDNFTDFESYRLEFSAFWINLPPFEFPPYICIWIFSDKNDAGVYILFNLNTLEIFQIEHFDIIPKENDIVWRRYHICEISEECHTDILNSIIEL